MHMRTEQKREKLVSNHSRPQSPRSFWSCARDRDLWQGPKQEVRESRTSGVCAQPQKFETITVTIGYKNGQLLRLRVTWSLPEVSIPGADQKDRGLWGREWFQTGLTHPFRWMSGKSKKVAAAGRGPFLFPTYLGRSKGLCSQGSKNASFEFLFRGLGKLQVVHSQYAISQLSLPSL